METFLQDVGYGLGMLSKSPGLTAVAVMRLALGIGANTAIFSLVNSVLRMRLRSGNPDKLVIAGVHPSDRWRCDMNERHLWKL